MNFDALVHRCYTARYLRLCRQFYETYPQIWKSLISEIQSLMPSAGPIVATTSPQFRLPARRILARLFFTHLIELLKVDDPLIGPRKHFVILFGPQIQKRMEPQITQIDADSGDEQKRAIIGATMDAHQRLGLGCRVHAPYLILSSLLICANLRNLWLRRISAGKSDAEGERIGSGSRY
jgi:hypothetical protein